MTETLERLDVAELDGGPQCDAYRTEPLCANPVTTILVFACGCRHPTCSEHLDQFRKIVASLPKSQVMACRRHWRDVQPANSYPI